MCFASKAVHLEIASELTDLTAQAFNAALRTEEMVFLYDYFGNDSNFQGSFAKFDRLAVSVGLLIVGLWEAGIKDAKTSKTNHGQKYFQL